MRKILAYLLFITGSIVVVFLFVTSTTYVQLVVAIALYPVIAFFAFNIFPPLSPHSTVSTTQNGPHPEPAKEVIVSDIDKRAFLKMIGAAGITLFASSIINKRVELPFFEKREMREEPPPKAQADDYAISEIDDSATAYYGFTNKDGSWFILREDSDKLSFRYVRGESDFSSNWASRQQLKYDYFSNVF